MAHPPSHPQTSPRAISPPAPPGPVLTTSPSPGTQLSAQRLADLLASVRDIASLNPLAGITSGQGNQGSANTAHLAGHAGTGADRLSIPMQLKFGTRTYQQ